MTVEIFAEAHQSQRLASFWLGVTVIVKKNQRRDEGVKNVARCCDSERLRCLDSRRVFGLCKRGYSFKNFWVRNKNPGRSPKLHNHKSSFHWLKYEDLAFTHKCTDTDYGYTARQILTCE